MENKLSISTSPRDRLKLLVQKDSETVVAFRVRNNGKKPVVCRLYSNQKELYVVMPTRFVLPVGGTKIVSVRCDVDTVNSILESGIPTRNILQIASYSISGEVQDDILACSSDAETKEFIGNNWEKIRKFPCEKLNLDVKFTNITYSACASPVGERADAPLINLTPYGINKESLALAFVVVGVAVVIGLLWRH